MPALNARDLRRKIKSIGNIKKITRAMQMVSAAKLKKVQERLMQLRPYSDKITTFVEGLAGQLRELKFPLAQPREQIKRVGVVIMMADKGLCGSYNSNMARYADRFVADLGKPVETVAIGRKAIDYVNAQSLPVKATYAQLPTEIPFAEIKRMTKGLVDAFLSKQVDEVHLLFTRYVNALTFKPGHVKFLPVEPPKTEGSTKAVAEYEFEPEPSKILDELIPRYVEVTFHRLLLESMSSEHAARMNAMRNATDNASDLITSLTLVYNKARQASITKELIDIVGGAEALK